MTASYAYTWRKGLSNEIRIGEGLVGQAALEKEPIVISNVPEGYISINSGLGEAVPRNMLVVPILQESKLMGILEVGSFKPFSSEHVELLELVNENIAVAINSSRDSDRMKDLLEEAQRSSEELQSQQAELKATNEELEEQTQMLKSSQESLITQSEELQQSNEELEEKSEYLEQQKSEIETQNRAIERSRQELVVKADELELSSKYKSEFLANMSHELRTPLNSLLILSNSLSQNREGNLTPEQVESAATVHDSGQELLELINDILDLSKVEAGKLSVHIETINTDALGADLDNKFKLLAAEKGIELNLTCESGLPSTIQTDYQRASQILKNLVSNAIKFTNQGSVTVNTHAPASDIRFKHSALTCESAIAISVTDSGIGIAEDKQREIFEAFQQGDGSTSRKFGGTGLGLTISRELARLLGGEIQLQSEVGTGSTFTLYLPFEERPERYNPSGNDIHPQTEKSGGLQNQPPLVTQGEVAEAVTLADDRKLIGPNDKSLLIVEDDLAFAQILKKLAHDRGYKCLCAGDGSSGIQLAQKYQPSGIVLDLGLPDIDGLAVLGHLKHDLSTRHIPVHIMSARDARIASLQAGAVEFLQKPVTEENIEGSLQKIEQILASPLKRVLVVEDNDANRHAVVHLIADKHIEITAVADGRSALECLESEEFDCVILDLDLPDTTGIDVLRQLEKQDNVTLPPVIIHTGRELSEEEHKELNHYGDSIVIKGAASPERLVDEVSLFLHSVTAAMPKEQQDMMRMMHEPDQALIGKRIMVVDDDVRNAFALSKELREHGMDVVLADNGQLVLTASP